MRDLRPDPASRNRALPFCLAGSLLMLSLPLAARPAIFKAAAAARLDLSAAEQISLPLAEGAELAAADETRTGWIAAGTRPAAGGLGREIFLLSGQGERSSALPAPPGGRGLLRQEPTPLVADGELAGLAWLEGKGARTLGVWVAPWEGAAWGEPRRIAAPGPGSQLALAAAPLADGSWLLAWSAYDGNDDDIVWSRGRLADPASWSAPKRAAADNRVPDITPALTAVPGGALLAWSTYDGEEYRTVVARFERGRFTAPEGIGGRGLLYPTFEADGGTAGGAQLLVRSAGRSRGWELWQLDAAARPRHRAALRQQSDEESARPAVSVSSDGASVSLRWPGRSRELAWNDRSEERP
jgi:hypothetical protein